MAVVLETVFSHHNDSILFTLDFSDFWSIYRNLEVLEDASPDSQDLSVY